MRMRNDSNCSDKGFLKSGSHYAILPLSIICLLLFTFKCYYEIEVLKVLSMTLDSFSFILHTAFFIWLLNVKKVKEIYFNDSFIGGVILLSATMLVMFVCWIILFIVAQNNGYDWYYPFTDIRIGYPKH